MKSKTLLEIRKKYGTITAWAKANSLNVQQCNDVLNRYAAFSGKYIPKNGSGAYNILSVALSEGLRSALLSDGWTTDTLNTVCYTPETPCTLEILESMCRDNDVDLKVKVLATGIHLLPHSITLQVRVSNDYLILCDISTVLKDFGYSVEYGLI